MFLLNSIVIGDHLDEDNGTLSIAPFIEKNLEHTFYYFTLGGEGLLNGKPYSLSKKQSERYLTLEPNDFAIIKTIETFTLSGKVLGILGQCSEITKLGLQLLHSPFIDPKFNRPLEFGLKNLNNQAITLEFGVSKIGKVSFFDISDTYPIKVKKNSTFAKRFLDDK